MQTHPFYFALYVAALVSFGVAVFNYTARINLIPLGLFLALLPTVLALTQT